MAKRSTIVAMAQFLSTQADREHDMFLDCLDRTNNGEASLHAEQYHLVMSGHAEEFSDRLYDMVK